MCAAPWCFRKNLVATINTLFYFFYLSFSLSRFSPWRGVVWRFWNLLCGNVLPKELDCTLQKNKNKNSITRLFASFCSFWHRRVLVHSLDKQNVWTQMHSWNVLIVFNLLHPEQDIQIGEDLFKIYLDNLSSVFGTIIHLCYPAA